MEVHDLMDVLLLPLDVRCAIAGLEKHRHARNGEQRSPPVDHCCFSSLLAVTVSCLRVSSPSGPASVSLFGSRLCRVAFVRKPGELVAERGKRDHWLFHRGKRPEKRV